jgi:hypothetical protein
MNMYTQDFEVERPYLNRPQSRCCFGCLLGPIKILLMMAWALGVSTGVKATSVSAPEFVDLVNESDYIVRAVVKSVTSHYAQPASRKIITKVEMEVTEVIAGKPPEPLILQILGGKVGQEEMILDGAPQFKEGDEGIYFVQNNGRQISPLVAMMHGLYPIKKEADSKREYVTRSNAVPLQNASEVALPITEGGAAELQRRMLTPSQALTPAEFAQQIRAAVKPSNPRLNEK